MALDLQIKEENEDKYLLKVSKCLLNEENVNDFARSGEN